MASFRRDLHHHHHHNHPDLHPDLHPERCRRLNNSTARPTRETTRPPISKYSNLHATFQATPWRMISLENMTSKAVDDLTSHAHRSRGVGLERWPMQHANRSLADIKAVVVADPQDYGRSTTIPILTRRHMLPGANLVPMKEAATLNKRKGSIPDLGLGPMTTVQEGCLDSPTIPGHHPLFIRSMSVPDYKLLPLSEDTSEKTPRGPEFPGENVKNSVVLEPTVKSSGSDRSVRSTSSMILQKDLARLVIASSTGSEQPIQACRDKRSDEHDDKPPQVPPKSPRTRSRASPRLRRLPHSATSSTSTIYSNTSAATSTSSLAGRTSPKPKPTPPRVESPFSQNGGLDDIKEQDSVGSRSSPSRQHTPPRVESPRSQPGDRIKKEQDAPIVLGAGLKIGRKSGHEKRIDPAEERIPIEHGLGISKMWYQRENSEPSVIDRARPMRRGDTSLMHSLSKPMLRSTFYKGEDVEIPTGFNAREASNNVTKADLKILKQQADERVENFEMLSLKDESDLSKELTLLDERCQYLRRTYTSLRQSRKGLHARMVSCLKSPRMAKFSCESVLRQEEALAELDLSIDDWVSKLEYAENRRSLIRQKLLEHLAATLTVKTIENAQPQRVNEVQTPPTSPEKIDNNHNNERRDVQSIKVYADSGVAALLSAIENEIIFMGGLASSS